MDNQKMTHKQKYLKYKGKYNAKFGKMIKGVTGTSKSDKKKEVNDFLQMPEIKQLLIDNPKMTYDEFNKHVKNFIVLKQKQRSANNMKLVQLRADVIPHIVNFMSSIIANIKSIDKNAHAELSKKKKDREKLMNVDYLIGGGDAMDVIVSSSLKKQRKKHPSRVLSTSSQKQYTRKEYYDALLKDLNLYVKYIEKIRNGKEIKNLNDTLSVIGKVEKRIETIEKNIDNQDALIEKLKKITEYLSVCSAKSGPAKGCV